jgi:hypothetical protein
MPKTLRIPALAAVIRGVRHLDRFRFFALLLLSETGLAEG